MRVLVIGSGGREHALCWKLRQSTRCDALYCAPGNPGIGEIAELVPIAAREIDQLADWADENAIDVTVVGPDDPLADGIVDAFAARDLRAFGPTRDAAQIEWSKSWAKDFCLEHMIPTAAFGSFDDAAEAHRYVDSQAGPVVVKADGLALGKGVFVCQTREEAHAAVDRALGMAGNRVVVEERLVGRELSAFAICDGSTYRMLPFACDHKRALEGDRGANTGGMGAYSAPPWLTPELEREVELRVIAPAVRGLKTEERPFTGFLYAGLMATDQGIRVIEFNARLGDPEAQVILPRLDLDLLDLIERALHGELSQVPVELPVLPETYCCVVLASGGYPEKYETGFPIEGLDAVESGVLVFHAGTKLDGEELVTNGGRVLGVSAPGASLGDARARAYGNAGWIHFDHAHFRKDIGGV